MVFSRLRNTLVEHDKGPRDLLAPCACHSLFSSKGFLNFLAHNFCGSVLPVDGVILVQTHGALVNQKEGKRKC
jgi:hypothetical protein